MHLQVFDFFIDLHKDMWFSKLLLFSVSFVLFGSRYLYHDPLRAHTKRGGGCMICDRPERVYVWRDDASGSRQRRSVIQRHVPHPSPTPTHTLTHTHNHNHTQCIKVTHKHSGRYVWLLFWIL